MCTYNMQAVVHMGSDHKHPGSLLSVKQAAEKVHVSEETIRRWIRSRKLRAIVIGKSFYIDPWQLDVLISTGDDSLSDQVDLVTVSMGLPNVMRGALLFDNAYFSLEVQFQRIKEDYLKTEAGLIRQKKEMEQQMSELNKWSKRIQDRNNLTEKLPDRPSIRTNNHYWVHPHKTLFVDIHFYFSSGALIDSALKKLQKDLADKELDEIVNKYQKQLKDLNDARNHIEHLDERIDRVSDLGNLINGRYRFDGKFYDLYFEDMKKLKDELCDYLLRKSQTSISQNK